MYYFKLDEYYVMLIKSVICIGVIAVTNEYVFHINLIFYSLDVINYVPYVSDEYLNLPKLRSDTFFFRRTFEKKAYLIRQN